MRRGEIWTVAASGDYTGKPRPSIILQDEHFGLLDSVTTCGFTTDRLRAMFRVVIEPSAENGLASRSSVMIDRIVTIPRARIGARLGELDAADMARVNRAVLLFLGFAEAPGGLPAATP